MTEPYLVRAGDLRSVPIETLRDEYSILNRRIGATPLGSERDVALPDDPDG